MKPDLTKQQKDSFEKQFKELVSKSDSTEAKKLLNDAGQIIWIANIPQVTQIAVKLHGKYAHDYVALLNRVNSRTI